MDGAHEEPDVPGTSQMNEKRKIQEDGSLRETSPKIQRADTAVAQVHLPKEGSVNTGSHRSEALTERTATLSRARYGRLAVHESHLFDKKTMGNVAVSSYNSK